MLSAALAWCADLLLGCKIRSADCALGACCQAVAKGVSEAELNRAKRATVTAVLSNLESRAIVAEDIGRQILTYGDRCAPV